MISEIATAAKNWFPQNKPVSAHRQELFLQGWLGVFENKADDWYAGKLARVKYESEKDDKKIGT